MTTASQGAGDARQGAVQIKFVTRSGTNAFTGSGYYYNRNDSSTPTPGSTTATASPRPKLRQNQIGGRVGGPIVIPGILDGHNKAFFFVNYEELGQPSDTTRQAHDPQRGGAGGQLQLLRVAAFDS